MKISTLHNYVDHFYCVRLAFGAQKSAVLRKRKAKIEAALGYLPFNSITTSA